MQVSETDRLLVERVAAAMQTGAPALDELLSLFTDDAVWLEPFTGATREHVGKQAIREATAAFMAGPRPPDFKLTQDRVDTDGSAVLTEWTCTSAVMPAPMRGRDRYTIRDGKIARLEITLLAPPG